MSESAKLTEIVAWPGVHEACRKANVSINFGYAMIWSGRWAAQKIGGQWRVSPRAIEKYMIERTDRIERRTKAAKQRLAALDKK